ncbi:MAG: 3-oxoacyl-ACP synthase III family protein, partial [Myxococcaceae bacterium]
STVSAAVGAALGARAACMDTRTGCSAGLFALATAALYHSAGAGPALVVGAETFSKVIPPESRVAAVSLGDGAAALVVGRSPGAALQSVFLETDGTLGRLITTDGALPPTPEEIARGGYVLSGMPDDLARAIPEKYLGAIEPALRRARLRPEEIELYVPHQTNRAVIADVASKAGIPPERTWNHVERHANVGSAGWMVAFAEARAEGRVKPGGNVLLAAVGGGMSWAAGILRC